MKEERYREEEQAGELNDPSVTEDCIHIVIYRIWNAGGKTGMSLVVHELPKVDKLSTPKTQAFFGYRSKLSEQTFLQLYFFMLLLLEEEELCL